MALLVLGFAPGSFHAQTVPAPSVQVAPSDVRAPVPTADAAPGKDKKPASWWASVDACLQDVVSIATSILLLLTYSALIVVVTILMVFVWRELRKNIVIIEPFEVPPSVAATGLTGAALVTQIKKRIDEIRRADTGLSIRLERRADGRTAPPAEYRMESATDLFILEASAAGFSTRDVLLFLRKVFNRPPIKVSGHLSVRDSAPMLMIDVRLQNGARIYELSESDILQSGAERILQAIDPGAVANFYAAHGRLKDMERVALELRRNERLTDEFRAGLTISGYISLVRLEQSQKMEEAEILYQTGDVLQQCSRRSSAAQIYMGVAARYLSKRTFDEAFSKLTRAVEIDPHNLQARFVLASILYEMDRLADSLTQCNEVLRMVTRDFEVDVTGPWRVKLCYWLRSLFRKRLPANVTPYNIHAGRALLLRGVIHGVSGRLEEAVADSDTVIRWGGSIDSFDWVTLVAQAMLNKGVALGQSDLTQAIAAYDALIERFGSRDEAVLAEQVAGAMLNKGVTLGRSDPAQEIAVYDALVTRYGSRDEVALAERVAKALFNKGVVLGRSDSTQAIVTYDALIARYGSRDEAALAEQVANAMLNKGVALGQSDPAQEIAVYAALIARFGSRDEGALAEQVAGAMLNKGVALGQSDPAQEIAVYDTLIERYGSRDEAALAERVAKAMLNKGVALGQSDPAQAIAVYDALIERYGSRDEAALAEQVAFALIARLLTLRESKSKAPQTLDPTDPEFQALITEWQTRNPAVAAQLLPALQSLTDPPSDTLPGDR